MKVKFTDASKRFFKVMMPGFHQQLNLPKPLCNKLKLEKSGQASIESRMGRWEIQVCRNQEGLICFRDGWPEFVRSHGLSVGDFVVFEHTGDLHFNAFVFDASACEKEFLIEEDPPEAANPNHLPKRAKREYIEKESGLSHQSNNLSFTLTMKNYHAQRTQCTIPCEFWRSNNIVNKRSVILRNASGYEWTVKLQDVERGVTLRMGRGWRDFFVGNNLKVGAVCVFHLRKESLEFPDVVMDVQIFDQHTIKCVRTTHESEDAPSCF